MSLYKNGKKPQEKKDESKMWVIALYLIKRINYYIVWFCVLTNALFIGVMLYDFNTGVVLFIFNQYIVVNYLYQLRKERKEETKNV